MKITNSAEYRKFSEEIILEDLSKLRQQAVNDNSLQNVIAYLETTRARSLVHRSIEQATGLTFEVVRDGLDPHIAAFVETANDNNYISEAVLDDPTLALHGAQHEAEHRANKVFSIALHQLSPEESALLATTFGITKLDETELIEGFNELSTFCKHGTNENSGYANKEVPLAEKIERLVQQELHISLLEIFRSGNTEKFIITLQQLATHLQLRQTLAAHDFSFTN